MISSGPAHAWLPADQFAGDLIRDLAVARLLITNGWNLLDQAGAPRWALRAARLACQAALAAAGPAASGRPDPPGKGVQRSGGSARAALGRGPDRGSADPRHGRRRAGPCLAGPAGGERTALQTLLRLALQRYARHGIGDAAVLEPLVVLAYCGTQDLGQHDQCDRGTGRQIRDSSGLAARTGGRRRRTAAAAPAGTRHDPGPQSVPHDEWAVEALATLGPELGQDGEAFLRGRGRRSHLSPAVESASAVRTLAQANPGLLLTLAERFYILDPGTHGTMGSSWEESGHTRKPATGSDWPPGTTARSRCLLNSRPRTHSP